MPFAELVGYALRTGLVTEPGFVTRSVDWMVDLAADGSVLGVTAFNEFPAFTYCPYLQPPEMLRLPVYLRRCGWPAVCAAAQFLVDRCSTILRWSRDPGDELRVEARHRAFAALIELACREVSELEPIRLFLENEAAQIHVRSHLSALKARPSSRLSFSLLGVPCVSLDVWQPWWRRFRSGLRQDQSEGRRVSLVTGRSVVPARTHPKISDLGGQAHAAGDTFVSFDKQAFTSYGFVQGENAVFDVAETAAYRAALAALLRTALEFGQEKIVHWSEDSSPLEPMRVLFHPNDQPNEPSPLDQLRASPAQNARTFVLWLAGARGRARVRHWYPTTRRALTGAVDAWFNDLEIASPAGAKTTPPQGLQALLLALRAKPPAPKTSLEGYLARLKAFQRPLLNAALNEQTPLPLPLVEFVIISLQAALTTEETAHALSGRTDRVDGEAHDRLTAKIALLKLYRKRTGDQHIEAFLNADHPDRAYQCGRLLAHLFRADQIHHVRKPAVVLHAPFIRAITLPAGTLEPLMLNALHTLRTLNATRPGLEPRRLDEWGETWSRMGRAVPSQFSSDDRTALTLGYYQQIVADQTEPAATGADVLASSNH